MQSKPKNNTSLEGCQISGFLERVRTGRPANHRSVITEFKFAASVRYFRWLARG